MWICLNDGFFSIVAEHGSENLLVRARMRGDVERVFAAAMMAEGASVIETPDRDYRFRTSLSRRAVAETISARARDIDYGNFKDSVRDQALHRMYGDFWNAAYAAQQRAAKTA